MKVAPVLESLDEAPDEDDPQNGAGVSLLG